MDVVKGIVTQGAGFFQAHGWKLVGFAIGWYMIKDEVHDYLAKKEKNASMRRARDPARVATFEGHLARTREVQQAKAVVEAAAAR
jgi:hypothetical protein